MPFDMNIKKGGGDAKTAALEAARQKASAPQNAAAITRWISPADCKDRIRLIFDDSRSMGSGPSSKMEQAREGTIEYMRNCIPNQTAAAVHLLGKETELENLNSNLIEVASKLRDLQFTGGGTPLFATMDRALDKSPRLTRMVAFTDGSPTDSLSGEALDWKTPQIERWMRSADIIITKANERSCPIDTVFFGAVTDYTENERKLLAYLAEKTGGYFMVFDPAKVNFRTAFKYLAPVNRLMLTSEAVRKEIQDGKRS